MQAEIGAIHLGGDFVVTFGVDHGLKRTVPNIICNRIWSWYQIQRITGQARERTMASRAKLKGVGSLF